MKLSIPRCHCLPRTVAPRRGAWIETFRFHGYGDLHFVAPRRGAWIETLETIAPVTG